VPGEGKGAQGFHPHHTACKARLTKALLGWLQPSLHKEVPAREGWTCSKHATGMGAMRQCTRLGRDGQQELHQEF